VPEPGLQHEAAAAASRAAIRCWPASRMEIRPSWRMPVTRVCPTTVAPAETARSSSPLCRRCQLGGSPDFWAVGQAAWALTDRARNRKCQTGGVGGGAARPLGKRSSTSTRWRVTRSRAAKSLACRHNPMATTPWMIGLDAITAHGDTPQGGRRRKARMDHSTYLSDAIKICPPDATEN
jgi:hypothetical protein